MRKGLYYICFIMLALTAWSCQHDEIYYRFNELKDARWPKNDTLVFDIDSTVFELNVPYDISLEVTNNVNYPYRNIWFFVQTNFSSDSVFNGVSKEYYIADEFGKWKGSGFGSLYQTSLSFMKGVSFKQKRNYRIKIEQGMRDEPLEGIEKVGIKIGRAE